MVKIDELERQVESCISSLLSSSAEALQRGRKRQAAIDEEIRGLVENCALATDISMKYINEKIGELETEKQQLAKLDHLFSDSAPFSFAAAIRISILRFSSTGSKSMAEKSISTGNGYLKQTETVMRKHESACPFLSPAAHVSTDHWIV